MLLVSYLKRDLAIKKNNNVTTLIFLAISVHAKVLHDPLVQYSRGLNPAQIDMAILMPDGTCCFGKGRGSTETPSAVRQSQRTGTANQSQHI